MWGSVSLSWSSMSGSGMHRVGRQSSNWRRTTRQLRVLYKSGISHWARYCFFLFTHDGCCKVFLAFDVFLAQSRLLIHFIYKFWRRWFPSPMFYGPIFLCVASSRSLDLRLDQVLPDVHWVSSFSFCTKILLWLPDRVNPQTTAACCVTGEPGICEEDAGAVGGRGWGWKQRSEEDDLSTSKKTK